MNGNNRMFCVGNVPSEVNASVLVDILRKNACVEPISMEMKRGCAVVEFSTHEAAVKAMNVLNGYNIMGSNLLVEPSMAQNRRTRSSSIQINNIPERYPWDDIHRLLTTFGNVEQYDKGPTKPDNTYSIAVTYETPEQAQQAHMQLNNFELTAGIFLKVDFVTNQNRGRGFRGNRGNPVGQQFMYPPGPQPSLRPADFPLRILVLSDMVGAIIGRAGGTIRQITQQSRARVDVHRKENAGSPEKVITIYGNPDNCSTACQKILEVMQQESNNQGRGEVPLKILAHNNLIGRIIGKNGTTIKRIMEQSETKVTVSSSIHDVNSFNLERVITVKGQLANISKAEQMISAKLRQSFENDMMAMSSQSLMFPGMHPMSMMSSFGGPPAYPQPRAGPMVPPYNNVYGSPYMVYPNTMPQVPELQKETVFVFIPNSAVGAIIGTGGSTIREMISASNASIKVAQLTKEETADRLGERKVTVVGTPEAQWKAQFMIFKKVTYEGYSASPDCLLKVEILVPSNQVGRIIGKGGQTVRELQRLTHAIIKFPNGNQNSEADESPVQITGDFYSSQAAQRQIRALVNRNLFANQRRRPTPQEDHVPQIEA